MKRIIALALSLIMALSLVACGGEAEGEGERVETQPESIVVLGQSTREGEMSILRDQLTKAGFTVELNTQPDYSSFSAEMAKGNYDIAVSGWTTATGNLDYAVRGIHHSEGDYNRSPILDEKVDQLIDKAATETLEASMATYGELETYMVDEMAYIIPMYSPMSLRAYNNEIIDVENLKSYKTQGPFFWEYDYVNKDDRAERPLVFTQTSAIMSSLDPIQGNDATMGTAMGNVYVKLINLTENDNFKTEGTISHSYAIADGNTEYYFLLSDDITFAKIENGEAVDTGILAGGEDVVYSLDRARNHETINTHKTYTLHNHMANVEMLTDLEELNTKVDSTTGAPIMETLKAGIDGEIVALTDKDADVDNANGTYQIIKITTTQPFPQVLNYLAHPSAGVLCKEQVEAYNSKFDGQNYDPTKDVCYGDFAAFKGGDTMLYCSGAYVMTGVDDYGATFVVNPGFKPGSDEVGKVQNIYLKFIQDATSATSAFRAGEVDALTSLNANDVATVEAEAKFTVRKQNMNSAYYCYVNLMEGAKMQDVNLRKAVLYAIDQNDFIAFKDGYVLPLYSTVDTFLQTGKVLQQDLVKSSEYLAAYQATKAE